jgi:hypothetical protein
MTQFNSSEVIWRLEQVANIIGLCRHPGESRGPSSLKGWITEAVCELRLRDKKILTRRRKDAKGIRNAGDLHSHARHGCIEFDE